MVQPETTASFGYWVRRRRLTLDLTQADLANRVGCATVTISKIERDERRPSRQMAELLAQHLAVPTEERERFLAVALGHQAVDHMSIADNPLTSLRADLGDLPPSSLPAPSTPFVGRATELTHLIGRLENRDCRLITLVGPGGFGKTRLAIRLGELVLDRPDLFSDSVFFVPLDGLDGPELVVPAIAAALHFTFHEQQAQESQLLGYLASKQTLLILDNAEQILNPDLVDRILTAAPKVKMVVTTREMLKLQQEWLHPVGGMDVGAAHDFRDDGQDRFGDALMLFQQCAHRVRPEFNLAHEVANVQEICRLVDGVPLAIELAAAWLKALPCEQVTQELARSIDILASSMQNMPARHRSMRAVLQQSWQYLTEEEQQIFRRLSVFLGGFRADAAQAVASTPIWMLAAFVEKSVLQLMHDGRYRIHTLLRQFGAEKLSEQSDELERVRSHHSEFYLAFLAKRKQSVAGEHQTLVLAEIQDEVDNIRVAWSFAAANCRLADLDRAFPALFRFLWTRGRYEEGEHFIAQALAATADWSPTQQPIRIRLRAHQALLASARGEHQRALSIVADLKALADELEAREEQALCLYVAGMIAFYRNERDDAITNLSAAYVIYRELNDTPGIAITALRLGYISMFLASELRDGQRLAEEGLALFRQLGDLANIADALDTVAVMHWVAGSGDEAEACYRESLSLAKKVGSRAVVARSIGGLGLVAWLHRDWETAIHMLHTRLEIMQDLGYEYEVNTSSFLIAGTWLNAGRYTEAAQIVDEHPHSQFNTAWMVQALAGVQRYAEAMSYLPSATAALLEDGKNEFFLCDALVAWAMILISDCPLRRSVSPSNESRPLGYAERRTKSAAILRYLTNYDKCRADTRMRASDLLASLAKDESVSVAVVTHQESDIPSARGFAQEMLTIHLA